MNVRLKKEFQSLFWPWLVTVLIGLLPVLNWMLPTSLFEQNTRAVYAIASAGFVLGTILLAALPFGEELNLRTLPMLLSQPCDRWQIWREKFHITLLLVGSAALIHVIGYLPFWGMLHAEWKVAMAFLVFSLCSATFWTLVARSTIGGAVLCLAFQSVLLLLAYAFTEKSYYTTGVKQMGSKTELFLLLTSLLLSPVFLWLGWFLFSRLQLAQNWSGEALSIASNSTAPRRNLWFRIKTHAPLRNLILKELRLYLPVFVMMALFACLWMTVVFTLRIAPQKVVVLTNVLNGFTLIYIPLVLLISGCISLSEEKSLGVYPTNLTSPVSLTKQWLIKVLIATLVGILGGIIVPILLVVLENTFSSRALDTGVRHISSQGAIFWVFCLLLTSSISLSFWASNVLNNTVKAAFFSGFSIVAITVFHSLGFGAGMKMGWLTAAPILWLTAQFQLSLSWFQTKSAELYFSSYSLLGFLFVVLSWRHYRLPQSSTRQLLKNAVAILACSFAIGIVVGDIRRTSDYSAMDQSSLYVETLAALKESSAGVISPQGKNSHQLHLEELIATGKLSSQTIKWLSDCTIWTSYPYYQSQPLKIKDVEHVQIIIDLNRNRDSVSFYIPAKAPPHLPTAISK